MKLDELIPNGEVLRESLEDPEFRQIWERTALARAVATALVSYRGEHGLSQRQLAMRLGWKQPQVARLEIGESNPEIPTLMHLSSTLGMHFAFSVGRDLTPAAGDIVERVPALRVAAIAGADRGPS